MAADDCKLPDGILRCSNDCDTTERNWKDADDDLMICVKSQCKRKFKIMCRACMTQSHKRKDHKPKENEYTFINIRETKSCTKCKLIYSQSTDIQLKVCIEPECKYQHQIMCNNCVKVVHTKN